MEKYYDPKAHRLIFLKKKADASFWESHWQKYDRRQTIRPAIYSRAILNPTKKYLLKGARVLEGGCGLAQNVWALHASGYDAYGIDYAKKTVDKLNANIPELNVRYGDVRKLEFETNFFDGYWSLGVIEHFYDGFDRIATEMRRVVRSGGYLFLTFPCISWLRELKIKHQKYPIWAENTYQSEFYQFALHSASVAETFKKYDFVLNEKTKFAGFKGLKDEVEEGYIRDKMQRLYDSKRLLSKGFVWGLNQIISPLTGHMQLMIFQNIKQP